MLALWVPVFCKSITKYNYRNTEQLKSLCTAIRTSVWSGKWFKVLEHTHALGGARDVCVTGTFESLCTWHPLETSSKLQLLYIHLNAIFNNREGSYYVGFEWYWRHKNYYGRRYVLNSNISLLLVNKKMISDGLFSSEHLQSNLLWKTRISASYSVQLCYKAYRMLIGKSLGKRSLDIQRYWHKTNIIICSKNCGTAYWRSDWPGLGQRRIEEVCSCDVFPFY
jgi:hypothetical protein